MVQHINEILDDFLSLTFRRIDQNRNVGQGQNFVIVRHLHQCHLTDQTVHQIVLLVQNRHQEVTGGGIAADQNITKTVIDNIDGTLHVNMVVGIDLIIRHITDNIIPLIKSQPLQHSGDPFLRTYQNGTAKSLGFRFKDCLHDILAVSAGNHHAGGTFQRLGTLNHKIKFFFKHMHDSSLLSPNYSRPIP